MSSKDYCSKICGAKCCRAHDPIISPSKCPMLTAENLCSIYERRLGFKFDGLRKDGTLITCVCTKPKRFLKTLAPEVLAQCCIAHPELLENDPSSATRRTGRNDCNRDAPAGFAAAHG